MVKMTPYQEIIYNVLYDRFHKWQQPITNINSLANETHIRHSTINCYLSELKTMGKINIKRDGTNIRILNV